MAQDKAPNRLRRDEPLVDPRTGLLTTVGFSVIDQLWRQVAAGFVTVPCTATGTNAIVLTPTLHKEGGLVLGNHMGFSFEAVATSSGLVTVKLADQIALKAYITNGATQANTGDVVDGSLYLALYLSTLDGGAGGFVIK